jgi:hypothetical protein
MDFMAGVWYENQLQMNQYSISMNLVTQTANASATNIAMDRLKYFVHVHMQNTVFISQERLEVAEMLKTMGINVTTLPGEPVDQIIGIMLYCKLNAIMENYMIINELEISSDIGENMIYLHAGDESLGPFENPGWWTESDLVHCDLNLIDSDKVVALSRTGAWRELNLAWPGADTPVENDNNIVFAEFKRDETK